MQSEKYLCGLAFWTTRFLFMIWGLAHGNHIRDFLSLCTALPQREVDDDGDPCHRNSLHPCHRNSQHQPTSSISTDFNGNSRYACFFWFIHNVLLTTSSALKNQTEFPHSRFSVCLRLKISNTLTNGNFIVEKLTSWSTMLPTICI